ncbi:hypothetical protein PMAYCL1PPCAC_12112 [Pristionchus mayeri]|uniref:Peptidase n=1 Tax=Pristionchus mayeri TaxID=1317129 RepID=A0AAN4ZIE6_9BILA|nr:hypothetical protein PMAYCL1PPCAC_12112 [Pristionchus mayeri]
MKALLLLFFTVVAIESRRRRFPHSSLYASTSNSEMTYTWKEYKFETRLDNFDFTNLNTFNIRYLVNMDSYSTGGPIFFYTGNEGQIEEFANATGLMWDLAGTFKAAVVLAEHRYYGDSQPYGDYDKSYASADTLAYLSSEQALADYAALLTWLKNGEKDPKKPVSFSADTKVIAFGGSYGGMLSAWFRMKYPHVVDGAYASSAPVLYFNNAPGVEWGGFDMITTETFAKSGCDNDVIKKSWEAVKNLTQTEEGQKFLNDLFNVDQKSLVNSPDDADALNDYIREGIEYMAMTDYSYPSDFLKPMPASPVKYACDKYLKAGSGLTEDKAIVTAMAGITSVYFNYNNFNPNYTVCFKDGCDDAGGLVDDRSERHTVLQECTEIVMTMCAEGGNNDFFWNECAIDPITMMKQGCPVWFQSQKWKEGMLGVNAISTEYGYSWNGVTNVILTNGELDPWRAGGVQKGDNARRLFATSITNSAHHFDLRQPNTCDPSNVAWIRYQAVQAMWCFIDSSKCTNDLDILDNKPSIMPTDISNCKDIVGGYPWGQNSTPAISTFAALFVFIAYALNM